MKTVVLARIWVLLTSWLLRTASSPLQRWSAQVLMWFVSRALISFICLLRKYRWSLMLVPTPVFLVVCTVTKPLSVRVAMVEMLV